MVLTKLKDYMGEYTPESLASKPKEKEFSNMTVRRALAGRGIDRLKALAIAKALRVKLEQLL